MNITRDTIKETLKAIMAEESDYQAFFKKALEKAGKSIPSMSDEEKKAFFNKIEKTWKGRGTKSEGNAFGAAVAKAKKDGDSNFKVGDKEYKVERFGRGDETELEEKYKGKSSDFKYDFELALDNMGISGKAIKKISKKGKGYEVRLSSYMSDKKAWEKIGKSIGAELVDFKKGSINIGLYESINEGPSTEEKRIAMLAVRKQAKYRNVSLEQAIQDQINALEELKRDAKRGKIK